MSYNKFEINAFEGLNAAIAPTLIKDSQARDILNFRMEKVGKLVTRNGYIYGLFSKHRPMFLGQLPPNESFFENNGIVGIGELVLSEHWDAIDTDRLMVYAIRSLSADEIFSEKNANAIEHDPLYRNNVMGEKTKNHYMTFLFSPITGRFANLLLANEQLVADVANAADFDMTIDARPQGVYERKRRLFAPNRQLPDATPNTQEAKSNATFNNGREDHWIRHYVSTTEYRHQMIVSDKINGDMIIEDEFNRYIPDEELGNNQQKQHALHIRPNCLEEFNIDIVRIDLRDQSGQENANVRQGMALYKFKLPKIIQKVSNFLCEGKFADQDAYPKASHYQQALGNFRRSQAVISSLQRLQNINGNPDVIQTAWKVYDGVDAHIFSNADSPSEVDDLLGDLEFDKQKWVDEDGTVKEDQISDVYIWEEYEIPYYIASGKQLGFTFLRELDRMFTKTTNAPRIKELNVKDEFGRQVPLGIWRYRFVWDFGDGVYSAPSADLNVPDILWSAVNDLDVNDAGFGQYNRPQVLSKANVDYLKHNYWDLRNLGPDSVAFYRLTRNVKRPSLYVASVASIDGTYRLTRLGRTVFDLKNKLYGGLNHRFGVKTATGYNDNGNVIDPLNNWDWKDYADFGAIILLNCGKSIELKGIFAEWGLVADAITKDKESVLTRDTFLLQYYGYNGLIKIGNQLDKNLYKYGLYNISNLILPIFPDKRRYTKYSLFTDDGFCRLPYKNRMTEELPFSFDIAYIVPGQITLKNEYQVDGNDYKSFSVNEIVLAKANVYNSDVFCTDTNCYIGIIGEQYVGSEQIGLPLVIPDRWVADIYEQANYQTGAAPNLFKEDPNDWTPKYFADVKSKVNYKHALIPITMLRASDNSLDTFLLTKPDVPAEAISRLALSGTAEIQITKKTDSGILLAEYLREVFTPDGKLVTDYRNNWYLGEYDRCRAWIRESDTLNNHMFFSEDYSWEFRWNFWKNGIVHTNALELESIPATSMSLVNGKSRIDNVEIYAYLPGTRFVGLEQLTAYFPSSLLFKAPRLGIQIGAQDIPQRARGIKIFRTLATHRNDWDPLSFGLVKDLKISRDSEGNPITRDEDDNVFPGVYFFDDVSDDNLDFSDNPDTYDGLRRALHSRFCVALNERVYYGNFTEVYQSLPPRSFGLHTPTSNNNYAQITNFAVIGGVGNKGFQQPVNVKYRYVYINQAGQLSGFRETPQIQINASPNNRQAVVLFWLPSRYDNTIKELEVYRQIDNGQYFYLGSVKPEDEGIFVDDNKPPGKQLGNTDPSIEHYEDGVRWSEPYQPDWIKLNNFIEYRSGDNRGVRITGLIAQEGNLLIFKENSIHRSAVQAQEPPISRTDEISSDVGCIAPNTLIRVDNDVYFLSAKGFMKFNNMRLEQADGLFNEELQYILLHNPIEFIRDASAAYNQQTKEIYLNIPMAPTVYTTANLFGNWINNASQTGYTLDTNTINERVFYHEQQIDTYPTSVNDTNLGNTIRHRRQILGHIYVISLEKGYVTKFAYPTTYLVQNGQNAGVLAVKTIDARQLIRLYYTNSIGELRSGDIFPRRYGESIYTSDPFGQTKQQGIAWSGIYIETMYNLPQDAIRAVNAGVRGVYGNWTNPDDVINVNNFTIIGGGTVNINTISDYDMVFDWFENSKFYQPFLNANRVRPTFPFAYPIPIDCEFKSKFFTAESETIIKRIRRGLINIFSKGNIEVRLVSKPYDGYDDRYEWWNENLFTNLQRFFYPPTDDVFDREQGIVIPGTHRNIITFVPHSDPVFVQDVIDVIEDRYGKPVIFAVDIKTRRHCQLNAISLHWRHIHTYLG